MNVLIACEESQRVCISFRERGHNAFSCDIQEPSGGRPEWHIQGDALSLLNPKHFQAEEVDGLDDWLIPFVTMDGAYHEVKKWDLIIAHPPCTFLTNTGNRWFDFERYGDKARERERESESRRFFYAVCSCRM